MTVPDSSTDPSTLIEAGTQLAELTASLNGWTPDLVGTLVFVRQGDQVLLIHKKTGHGAGLINGPGGKVQPGETSIECAHRELHEELGIRVSHLEQRAVLRFVEQRGDQWLGYAFVAFGIDGLPRETPEARPLWTPITDLPLDRMWPDDRVWLPMILAGEHLEGDFLFNDGALLAHRVRLIGTSSSQWDAVPAGDVPRSEPS
ncbi:MAG: 8-oxo-dGTP diphosphatase [Pseudomonadota bacterium]